MEANGEPQTGVVILDGFDNAQIGRVIRALKGEFSGEVDIAFAKSTPNSLSMSLGDLVEDIRGDHAYLKRNPPQPGAPTGPTTPGDD